ncbi:phage tail tape measure protein, partial [Staphylococcus agnetis]
TKSIDGSKGAANRMSKEMEGGIGGSLRQMKSAIESLAISIGDVMAPYIKKLAEWVSHAASKLNEMPKGTQKIVV